MIGAKPDGIRYEAVVPETLDLVDRAELALNGLGGVLEPERNYEMYFFVRYGCRQPYMYHWGFDQTNETKFAESFPMMRIMTGTDTQRSAEEGLLAAVLSRISPEDGLYYNLSHPDRPWHTIGHSGYGYANREEDFSSIFGDARLLRAMMVQYELEGTPHWENRIHALVRGLEKIAIRRDDYAYYPDGGFGEAFTYPRSGWLKTDEPKSEVEGGEGSVVAYQGNQIRTLSQWYALSGDAAALELATRLTRFTMKPKFWGGVPNPHGWVEGQPEHVAAVLPDPACIAGAEQGHWYSHFHSRAIALRGILEYGMVTRDARALEFVRQAYEYTWTMGIARTGWVNCWPGSENSNNQCEGCALGDLVALGIRLSDAGVGDYWDNVDALVRNQLIEQQMVRADDLYRIASVSPEGLAEGHPVTSHFLPGQTTHDNVIARSLGNFAGHSTPAGITNPWVMQCCTGNATQGLYYAWEGIVRHDGDSAQVNLLLNRASAALDIDSYLPYAGKVILHNKGMRRIVVRIPFWVQRRAIRTHVSGVERPLAWVGNYLLFDDLTPDATIQIDFPVEESTATYTTASQTKDEQSYRCTIRGSTVVDISPRHESAMTYPHYMRAEMRSDVAPMKQRTRFVADKIVRRW